MARRGGRQRAGEGAALHLRRRRGRRELGAPGEGNGRGAEWVVWHCAHPRSRAPGLSPLLRVPVLVQTSGGGFSQAKREPGEDPAALAGGGTPPGCAALAGQARRE